MKQRPSVCGFRIINFFLLLFIIIFTVGCPQSLVYSTSANLPPRPLTKNQGQFLFGVGMLPEARPDAVEKKTAVGGETTFRFAFSDTFAIQAKGWLDFSKNVDFSRYGFSASGIFMLNSDKALYRMGIMPTGAALFAGDGFAAGGGALPLCIWFPEYKKIYFYTSFGPGFGMRNSEAWGFGFVLSVGTAVLVSEKLTLNLEVSSVYQNNADENVSHFIFAPSFNLGVVF